MSYSYTPAASTGGSAAVQIDTQPGCAGRSPKVLDGLPLLRRNGEPVVRGVPAGSTDFPDYRSAMVPLVASHELDADDAIGTHFSSDNRPVWPLYKWNLMQKLQVKERSCHWNAGTYDLARFVPSNPRGVKT